MTLAVTRRDGETATSDGDGSRVYTRNYQVLSTINLPNTQETEYAVLTASGLPLMRSVHPVDIRAYVWNKSVSRPNWKAPKWDVVVTWKTLTREEKKKLVHPTQRPVEISSDGQTFREAIDRDIGGGRIANLLGHPFDPPVERDQCRRVLTFKRNEASEPFALASQYTNAVNSDNFKGAGPRTVKCARISYQRVIEEWGTEGSEEEVEYWPTTYEFHENNTPQPAGVVGNPGNQNGWRLNLLHTGYYQKLANGNIVPCKDQFGNAMSTPSLLDANSLQIAIPPAVGAEVYIPFTIYKELPFAAFNL